MWIFKWCNVWHAQCCKSHQPWQEHAVKGSVIPKTDVTMSSFIKNSVYHHPLKVDRANDIQNNPRF